MKYLLKRYLSILLALIILVGSLGIFPEKKVYAREDIKADEINESVISKDLLKKLDTNSDKLDVMILFKEEASINNVKSTSKSLDPKNIDTDAEKKAFIGELKEVAYRSQSELTDWLDQEKKKGSVEEYTSFFIVNSMHLIANRDVIKKLSLNENVKYIDLNRTIKQDEPIVEPKKRQKRFVLPGPLGQIEWNIKRIGANNVWDKFKVTGKGVTVGIFDSEISFNHPALKRKFKGYDENTGKMNFTGNYFDAVDFKKAPSENSENSHGSHCMGIILGSEVGPGGVMKNQIGVAPDAKFISARVFGDNGESSSDGFLQAAQWMIAPNGKAENAPQVINNSWGGAASNNNSPWFRQAVKAWRDAGILPVFASGNWAYGEPIPGPGSISTPGSYPESLAVGAVDYRDKLGVFSKRGPSSFASNQDWKPELVAPGITIRSSVGNRYEYMTGTSMAAPHVTGSVALVKSANSQLTDTQIQDILVKTAEPLTDASYKTSPNHGYGYGMVDVYKAVSEALGKGNGRLYGNVTGKDEKEPIKANLYIKETGRKVLTDSSNGSYSFSHPAGKWTLLVKAYGYNDQEIGVEIGKKTELNKDIVLEKKSLSRISIMLEDESKNKIDKAFIRILEDSNIVFEDKGQGLYTSTLIGQDEYTLRVYKPGYNVEDIKISLPLSEDLKISLTSLDGQIEEEIKYDNGTYNNKPEENFLIGKTGYQGAATRFDPRKKGAVISSVSFKICKPAWFTQGNKGKLSIMTKDSEGRLISILDDLKFEFTYDETKTISLAPYNIKVDKPFFAVVMSDENTKFSIGLDQNADRDYSYIYHDNNLIPIESEIVYGGLMMRATISYPQDGEDIVYSVDPPSINPVYPNDKFIKGKAKPGQSVQLVLENGLRLNTDADESGSFTFKVKKKLITGSEITCYSKDENGVRSKASKSLVLNDDSKILELIKKSENIISSSQDSSSLSKLKDKVTEAKKLLNEIKAYERTSVEKEKLLQYQEKIMTIEKDLKKIIIELTPEKEELLKEINKARKSLDDLWVSENGREVPTTKKYISKNQWLNFNNAILNALTDYNNTNISVRDINRAIERLKDAVSYHQSYAKKGLEELLVVDERYRDGTFEGEGRGNTLLANHIVIEIKDGKLLDVRIKEWNDNDISKKEIINSGFLDRIIQENALDIKRVEGYEQESRSIIKAIQQALEKALKDGINPNTDKNPLDKAIKAAEEILNSVKVSRNGKDVAQGEFWVTQREHDDLKKAISDARAEFDKDDLTIDLRDRAITLLQVAQRNFISSKKTGVIEEEDVTSLKDGIYDEVAFGKNREKENKFRITIKNGKIVSVEILEWVDTPGYDKKLKEAGIFEAIIKDNTSEVDTVSNATESSKSLRDAVAKALKRASKENSEPEDGEIAKQIDEQVTKAKNLLFETRVIGSKIILKNRLFKVNKHHKNSFIKKVNDLSKAPKNEESLNGLKDAIKEFERVRRVN